MRRRDAIRVAAARPRRVGATELVAACRIRGRFWVRGRFWATWQRRAVKVRAARRDAVRGRVSAVHASLRSRPDKIGRLFRCNRDSEVGELAKPAARKWQARIAGLRDVVRTIGRFCTRGRFWHRRAAAGRVATRHPKVDGSRAARMATRQNLPPKGRGGLARVGGLQARASTRRPLGFGPRVKRRPSPEVEGSRAEYAPTHGRCPRTRSCSPDHRRC